MRRFAIAVVVALVVSGCVLHTDVPASSSFTSATPMPSATPFATAVGRSSAAPSNADSWRGLYLRLVVGTGPLIGGGRLQLVEATGSLPGVAAHPDLTWWTGPAMWSPDGTQALLSDRDGAVFIRDRAGSLTQLSGLASWGNWQWLANDQIASIHQRGSVAALETLFARVDARTGRTIEETVIPNGVTSGSFSPDGKWLAFSQPGPHRPLPAYAFEFATKRLTKVTDGGIVGGWLPDGHLVIWNDEGTVEALSPSTNDRLRIKERVVQVLAQPHSRTVVMTDRDGGVWSVVPGDTPAKSPTVLRAQLHSISADGQWVSFTEPIERIYPDVSSARAGVLHLATGKVAYACERDCEWLTIR